MRPTLYLAAKLKKKPSNKVLGSSTLILKISVEKMKKMKKH